jgi:hypothetical protein
LIVSKRLILFIWEYCRVDTAESSDRFSVIKNSHELSLCPVSSHISSGIQKKGKTRRKEGGVKKGGNERRERREREERKERKEREGEERGKEKLTITILWRRRGAEMEVKAGMGRTDNIYIDRRESYGVPVSRNYGVPVSEKIMECLVVRKPWSAC